MKWFGDTVFTVYPNIKNHSGYTIIIEKSVIISNSVKQKLNTTSSTKSELVYRDITLKLLIKAKLYIQLFYIDMLTNRQIKIFAKQNCLLLKQLYKIGPSGMDGEFQVSVSRLELLTVASTCTCTVM